MSPSGAVARIGTSQEKPGRKVEPAAEDALARVVALGVDGTRLQLTADLVREDHPAGRRPGDRLDGKSTGAQRDLSAKALGALGPLETWNFSRYCGACRADDRTKCPSRSAPESRNSCSTSAPVTPTRTSMSLRDAEVGGEIALDVRPDQPG